MCNGFPVSAIFLRDICSVVRQNALYLHHLLVEEQLYFTSELMMANLSREERFESIRWIIDHLRMKRFLATPIGTVDRRGISDGEKRKLALACVLMMNPK